MTNYTLINIIDSSNINLISESILKWFNKLSYEEKILQVSYMNKAISEKVFFHSIIFICR